MRVGLNLHGSSFRNRHLVAKDSLKLNNTINTCLLRLNSILYYSLSLNTCECLISTHLRQNFLYSEDVNKNPT